MILELNDAQFSAIKSIAVKNETNIKCTTRFMSGKLLMFAKLSLKRFIHLLNFCTFLMKTQFYNLFITNTI